MTRYFIPKDVEPSTAIAGVRRMTVYVYSGDSTPIPDYYDEVQLVPADAIVIRREELPEVHVDGDRLVCGWVSWPVKLARQHAATISESAIQGLAISEYLREHPPVDEAQVRAFLDLLDSSEGADAIASPDITDLARFLVKHAARVEVTP